MAMDWQPDELLKPCGNILFEASYLFITSALGKFCPTSTEIHSVVSFMYWRIGTLD